MNRKIRKKKNEKKERIVAGGDIQEISVYQYRVEGVVKRFEKIFDENLIGNVMAILNLFCLYS